MKTKLIKDIHIVGHQLKRNRRDEKLLKKEMKRVIKKGTFISIGDFYDNKKIYN